MNDWVTPLTSLGGLVTAIAALWTIREMRQQRTSMYLPDVVATRTDFFIYSDSTRPFGLPFVLVSAKLIPGTPAQSPLTVAVKCYNVGLGAAKQLKAKWNFDVQEFIFKLGEADPDRAFPIWNDEFAISLPADQRHALSIFKHHVEREEPYLLPAQSGAQVVELTLPFAYVHLYTVSLLLSLRGDRDQREWVFPPPLDLELSYSDVGGSRYTKRFRVTPEPMYAFEMGDARTPTLTGQGEFTVKPIAG